VWDNQYGDLRFYHYSPKYQLDGDHKIFGKITRIFCPSCTLEELAECRLCSDEIDARLPNQVDARGVCHNHQKDECSLCEAKEWLHDMIECKHCNKRFCKKCQENGSLGRHLFSQKDSLHVCSFSQREINTACDRSDSLQTIWAMLASYRFNQKHDTFDQNDDAVLNECLMDYNFIVSGNEMSKVLKKYNKTRRRKKRKSYWDRKNDKRGNQRYNQRSNQKKLLLFIIKNEI